MAKKDEKDEKNEKHEPKHEKYESKAEEKVAAEHTPPPKQLALQRDNPELVEAEDSVIVRGEGPLLDGSGRRGEGPIIEAVPKEEHARRKGNQEARIKEERESAIAEVEVRKGFKEPRGKEASHEDWKPADLSKKSAE